MTIICVDDDAQTAKRTAAACQKIAQVDEAVSFTSPMSALEYFDEHIVDIAILDISMPRMSGIELASKIKQKSLSTAIIFLTTFPQYAADAFTVHATGYMLKPLDEKRLLEEISYARLVSFKDLSRRIVVQTFGGFDVFVDGRLVLFAQKNARSCLLFLLTGEGTALPVLRSMPCSLRTHSMTAPHRKSSIRLSALCVIRSENTASKILLSLKALVCA